MRGVRSSGPLMCIASAAAFGAMGVFGKLAYGEGATVGTLLAVRFALAALLFWALIAGRGALRALPRRDVALGLGLGAGGYALQAGCYFTALERIDASLLSLLLYTFPAIVAVAAVALGRERLDARKVAALALASGGLVLVVAGAGAGATSGTQPAAIDYATKKGVFVVTTTRAGAGRIAAGRGGRGRGASGPPPEEIRRRIAGEDLAPVKARVLLMLALTRTSDPAEIQRMFTEY